VEDVKRALGQMQFEIIRLQKLAAFWEAEAQRLLAESEADKSE
jgi:hypothetical protein